MLYYSIGSRGKMVHFADCPRAKLIKDENRRSFRDIHEAHKNGYTTCPCCSPTLKKFKKEKSALISFSQQNGLAMFLIKDALHIHTTCSEWRIVPWDNKHKLRFYHESSSRNRTKQDISGYHRQKFSAETLAEYLEYIANHEVFRMNESENLKLSKGAKTNPGQGSKKRRKQKNKHSRKVRNRKAWQVIHLIDAVCEKSRCLEM